MVLGRRENWPRRTTNTRAAGAALTCGYRSHRMPSHRASLSSADTIPRGHCRTPVRSRPAGPGSINDSPSWIILANTLQPVDVALHGAGAPRQREGVVDRREIG